MEFSEATESFRNECLRGSNNVRYFSGFTLTGFQQGYNPETKRFYKRDVSLTSGLGTWFHIPREIGEGRSHNDPNFSKRFVYWLFNHALPNASIRLNHKNNPLTSSVRSAAYNAIFIDNYFALNELHPEYQGGHPVVFSGMVDRESLSNNGFFHTFDPVEVDRLYKVVCSKGDPENNINAKVKKIEDISSLL